MSSSPPKPSSSSQSLRWGDPVTLLVLDEVHHTLKKHPYRDIALEVFCHNRALETAAPAATAAAAAAADSDSDSDSDVDSAHSGSGSASGSSSGSGDARFCRQQQGQQAFQGRRVQVVGLTALLTCVLPFGVVRVSRS